MGGRRQPLRHPPHATHKARHQFGVLAPSERLAHVKRSWVAAAAALTAAGLVRAVAVGELEHRLDASRNDEGQGKVASHFPGEIAWA
jgi:hypothetical protein